ncbi:MULTISPECIES: 50S ribosomal protein L25/general stress protein Ctc [unclassified Imperialibacter]|uniref:50S ribosomal protein L25/general stress protein Ctc n=1 Tax=unclassified Imperialibacter TaxID=2629706 RepID=UPI00125AA109|nr:MULTISPECIES: 50S ribosomal protein L25/general stress protein Ctc [unclassified Imperialibacter]CAD5299410.1 50S ribosomal protein L25 [Imperialibacter sp. 89]CAD5299996.1 50S ribosomal protein L25 [Imperialibacter sp. 75]VVT15469.1 50S ribosomal protein L25 [Imperialibacter sp. EC-SDR9]
MKTVEIIGFKRANLGKKESKDLRAAGSVPCVIYGGKSQVHFHAPMILFRDLVYTPNAAFVHLNVEGQEFKAILQDIQFHPVNEMILHADFLELNENSPVKLDIPVKFLGVAPGVQKGGKLVSKMRKLTVKALPSEMPEFIEVDISKLELGKTVKVGELGEAKYNILNSPLVSIASVEVPRALKGKGADGEEEEEEA